MSEKMGPTRVTTPELNEVLAELVAREPIFHRPEFGTKRADFEAMTQHGPYGVEYLSRFQVVNA